METSDNLCQIEDLHFFPSSLLAVCDCIRNKKINTSAYHPQNDGLVEQFKCTLIDMLANPRSHRVGWTSTLCPFNIPSHATSLHQRISVFPPVWKGSPAAIRNATVHPSGREVMCLDDYKSILCREMQVAWDQVQQAVLKAQKQQKQQHNRETKNADFNTGDRVFVYMPATNWTDAKTGPAILKTILSHGKAPKWSKSTAGQPIEGTHHSGSLQKMPSRNCRATGPEREDMSGGCSWALSTRSYKWRGWIRISCGLRFTHYWENSHRIPDCRGDIPPWRGRLRPCTRASRTSWK